MGQARWVTGRVRTRPLPAQTSAPDACGCAEVTESSPGQRRARAGSPCRDCLPGLSSPQDRLAALREDVRIQVEPLVTLTHLLQLCRDEHRVLWERVNDLDWQRRASGQVGDLRRLLPTAGTVATLTDEVRAALAAALDPPADLPPVLVAKELAELLDERYWHTFVGFFRRHSPYQPSVGDPIPLDTPNLPAISDLPPTAPPWRLANRLDQTRRIRLAGEWAVQYRVVFDYSLYDLLGGIVDVDTVIATCHPNRSLDELEAPTVAGGRCFPVRPKQQAAQEAVLDDLVAEAVAEGASIVVLPELCVDEASATRLQAWTRRPDGPRLLVAGTYHHEDATSPRGGRRRRNTALTWVRGSPAPLWQDKHSPADHPIAEDIQPQGWPEMRVYVTADGWHLVIAICRDLLNPEAVHALTEVGANLILVPAMSESLVSFGGPAAHLVGASQALVAVANNPGEWPNSVPGEVRRPARGLFGHPGFGQQIRFIAAPDPGPGLALHTVRSGRVRWLPIATRAAAGSQPARAPARPGWAQTLATASTDRGRPASSIPMGRAAAVLVPLIDAPDGPRVLLTRRTSDLAHYPDRLVFPGGLIEVGDGDAVDAALREAQEEVGLAPGSVDVLGLLHPLALPDSGFVVTPVLARVTTPSYELTINQAEVAGTAEVPLSALSRQHGPALRAALAGNGMLDDPDADVGIGAMTAAVCDQVLGILGAEAGPAHFTVGAAHAVDARERV